MRCRVPQKSPEGRIALKFLLEEPLHSIPSLPSLPQNIPHTQDDEQHCQEVHCRAIAHMPDGSCRSSADVLVVIVETSQQLRRSDIGNLLSHPS